MSTFDRIAELSTSDGPEAALDFLSESLRDEKNYHKLFDALLLKKKHELGLPLMRPTSLDDVPDDLRTDFEHGISTHINGKDPGQFPQPLLDPLLPMLTALATKKRPSHTPRDAVVIRSHRRIHQRLPSHRHHTSPLVETQQYP